MVMNDQPTPLTDHDLSAYLDGEADEGLAARIETDATAQARLAQLRAASTALTDEPVTPLAPGVVDDLIATALAAADASPANGSTDAEVHPLAPPQPARRGVPSWLVAAVVVVLMGVGLALVWSGTHSKTSSTSDLATSATTEKSAESKAAADSDAATGGDASASAATPDASGSAHSGSATTIAPSASVTADTAVIQLGSFPTAAALRTALARAFPTEPNAAKPSVTTAALNRCSGLLQQVLPVAGGPVHVGVATVAGKTVAVYEFVGAPDATSAEGSTTVPRATTLTVAVHPAACDRVLAFQR